MSLAQLDAWAECVVEPIHNEVERCGQRQKFSSELYGRCLRHAVVGLLMVTSEAVTDVQTAEYDNDGIRDKVGSALCGSFERIATVVVWTLSAEHCT